MAYKQKSSGLPFKQMGSSPAKHYVDDNREHNTPEHSDDLQTPEEHKTGKVESPAKQYKKPTGPRAEVKPEKLRKVPMTNEEMNKDDSIRTRISEGSIETQALRRKKNKAKVDPDAPGTPGKPGYEPPVKRSDLDAKGKAIWDALKLLKKVK